MSQRRLVRVAPSFFERLDELLPAERTAEGAPSTTDFLLHEIPQIIDRLARDYETATTVVPYCPESGCSSPPASSSRISPSTRRWPPTARSRSSPSTSPSRPADHPVSPAPGRTGRGGAGRR